MLFRSLHKAIGDQLVCVFVDNGLLRLNEGDQVMATFAKNMGVKVIRADAEALFLGKLAGVDDPEAKRKVIGNTFIEVFDAEASKLTNVKWLAQGTIYPDVIESAGSKTGKAHVIKSHHNVGGLPEDMKMGLVEPLRELFKDAKDIINAIFISCQSKAIIVAKDEKEQGIRAILNFGHTLGHALESHLKYSKKLNHGEAIIIGMRIACKISHQLGFLTNRELDMIKNIYEKLNLTASIKPYVKSNQISQFIEIMKKDKKNNNNYINLILLKQIGKAFIDRKSTRLNSSHPSRSRMPSSA